MKKLLFLMPIIIFVIFFLTGCTRIDISTHSSPNFIDEQQFKNTEPFSYAHEFDTNQPAVNTWQNAYLEIICHMQDYLAIPYSPDGSNDRNNPDLYNPSDNLIYLGIHDFDNDTIPELLLGDSLTMAAFTFTNGSIQKLADLYFPDILWCINGVLFNGNSVSIQCAGSDGCDFVNWGYLDGEYKLGLYSQLCPELPITINGSIGTLEDINQIYSTDYTKVTEEEYRKRLRLLNKDGLWSLRFESGEEYILDSNFDYNLITW